MYKVIYLLIAIILHIPICKIHCNLLIVYFWRREGFNDFLFVNTLYREQDYIKRTELNKEDCGYHGVGDTSLEVGWIGK